MSGPYIPPSRESVYSTLFSMLSLARLNGLPAWVTAMRTAQSQEQINGAEKPVLLMLQGYEEWKQNNSGLPYIADAVVEVYIFVNQPDPNVDIIPQLNNLVDAALAQIAPPTPGAKQTMGGLVENVVLRGKAEYYTGLKGIVNAFACFPITIIQPKWETELSGAVVSGVTVTAFVGAGVWSEGNGVPVALTGNGNYYLNLLTGDVYLQQGGSWGTPVGNILGGSTGMPSHLYHTVSTAGTNTGVIKASAGAVTGWKIFNKANYPIYVKLFNKAIAPVLGTDVPQQVIGVNAGMGDVVNGPGTAYAAGISIAIVQGISDSDGTPVAANDCVVDIFYA